MTTIFVYGTLMRGYHNYNNLLKDKATFLGAIRARASLTGQSVPFGEPNHIMPYRELGRMTDQDLGAIYDYLRTLAPVKNKVTRFEKL